MQKRYSVDKTHRKGSTGHAEYLSPYASSYIQISPSAPLLTTVLARCSNAVAASSKGAFSAGGCPHAFTVTACPSFALKFVLFHNALVLHTLNPPVTGL